MLSGGERKVFKKFSLLAAAFTLVVTASESSRASQAAPATHHYLVKRATGPINIDGKLEEADWAACKPIRLVGYNEGVSVKQQTTARILWDDGYLYISWHCEDSQIWSTLTVRDDTLYQQEVVEVFINPDGDREAYLELEVNSLGTLWDGFVLKRDSGLIGILAWNSFELRRGVNLEGTVNDPSDKDKSWSVELAVPLDELVTAPNVPSKSGDKWRLNLYRIDLPQRNKELADYSAWSPVSGESYHDPDRFGEIEFFSESVR